SDLLEPKLRTTLSSSEPIRVAFLRPGSVVGASFGDALFRVLRFNGKSALDNREHFREIVYPDPTGGDATPASSGIARSLSELVPQVVLVLDDSDFVLREIVPRLEIEWPADAPRPFYLWGSPIR